jgi:DNA polymerase-4
VGEPASVDEFYLGLDGTEALYRNEPLAVTASRIREDVLSRTGLTVSIGGGTNRLIAKLAVERAKPRPGTSGTGIHIVAEGHEAEFVAGLDLSDLPGVGPRFAEALRRHGLVRVRDALGLDRGTLGGWFGPRTGAWLYDRIRGISRTPVSSYAEPKSVSRESTFHVDLETDDALETELVRLVTRVCHDLRSDGLGARTVTVKLRDFDFRTRQASRTLDEAISSDRAVLPVARQLLRRLREERRTGARLLGVGFTQLSPGDRAVQLGLFPGTTAAAETERDRTVARTVDRIQERFGSQAIRPARLASPPAHRGMIEEDEVG